MKVCLFRRNKKFLLGFIKLQKHVICWENMLIFSSFIFPLTFFRPALCCVKQRKQEKSLEITCMKHVSQEGIIGDRGFLKIKMLFDMTWLVLSTFMLALYLCSIQSGTSLWHCDKQLIRELLKVPKSKIFVLEVKDGKWNWILH